MLQTISRILSRCGSPASVLPPTQVFNEGWLLRIILDWLDRNRDFQHLLSPFPGAIWYSEALLPSRFLPEIRGDIKAESFTHADGVVGHFKVASGSRGDAVIQPNATQFIVAEAKLGSALSAGTKNAPTFDQAARNVACMAHMLGSAGVDPASLSRIGFCVLAPRVQIDGGVFSDLVTKPSIESKVRNRLLAYGGKHDGWFANVFLPTLERIELNVLSWESILDALPENEETSAMKAFYANCLRFNPLRLRGSSPVGVAQSITPNPLDTPVGPPMEDLVTSGL